MTMNKLVPGTHKKVMYVIQDFDSNWNKEIGTREFWEFASHGNGKIVSLFEKCPYGYERSTHFSLSPICEIPENSRFLGESCDNFKQCDNEFVAGMLDVTCAPSNDDASDPQYKCMIDEDYVQTSKIPDTCSCIGLIACRSDDCRGSMCVLSEGTGKKHCRYTDKPVVFKNGACSNCRHDKNPCKSFEESADKSFLRGEGNTVAVI